MFLKKREGTGRLVEAYNRSKARYEAMQRPARIGFIIDATSSRSQTWTQAQAIQRRMFEATAKIKGISVRLVHFGGRILTNHGWQDNADRIAADMAGVACQTGLTRIIPALKTFVDEPKGKHADAIILIGDCYEEYHLDAGRLANALSIKGIRVYAFLEGEDEFAEAMFRTLADGTGGRFARFGDDMPLGDLCTGVAMLAAGGNRALKKLPNRKARKLLLTDKRDDKGVGR